MSNTSVVAPLPSRFCFTFSQRMSPCYRPTLSHAVLPIESVSWGMFIRGTVVSSYVLGKHRDFDWYVKYRFLSRNIILHRKIPKFIAYPCKTWIFFSLPECVPSDSAPGSWLQSLSYGGNVLALSHLFFDQMFSEAVSCIWTKGWSVLSESDYVALRLIMKWPKACLFGRKIGLTPFEAMVIFGRLYFPRLFPQQIGYRRFCKEDVQENIWYMWQGWVYF